ncbi:ParB/RepB/Spo0J family partition protein [bacterium]|nr:ParB/RepB/Spo0J family partition protein [bacterium]
MNNKYGLGKGLSSLIPKRNENLSKPKFDDSVDISNVSGNFSQKVLDVEVQKIEANPWQPRTNFDQQKLEELMESIREHGIIQPLILTQKGDAYELIAGERRLKASKMLKMFKVPAIIIEADNSKKLQLALIENIQRQNLNLLEEAEAYDKLIEEFDLTQEEVAQKVGKSRSTIANILRLNNLSQPIKKYLRDDRISFGHAKLLLSLDDEKKQLELLKKILNENLNVKDTSEEVKSVSVKSYKRSVVKDPNISAKEEILRNFLNTKVKINDRKGKGSVVIDYYSKEELKDILGKILD